MPGWGTSRRKPPENFYHDLANPQDERVGATPENNRERFKNNKIMLRQAEEAERNGDERKAQHLRRLIGD